MSPPITGLDARVQAQGMTRTEDGFQVEHSFQTQTGSGEAPWRLLLRGPHDTGDYSYVLSHGHDVLAHGRALHPSAGCHTDGSCAADALRWILANHELADHDGHFAAWEEALRAQPSTTREGT